MTARTLRDYAGFAAFQLKSATIARMIGQNFQALDPVARWVNTRGSSPAMGAERVKELVQAQSAQCRCLDSVSFFYQVTFAESGIATTSSELATPENLRRIRDTVIAETPGPSRTGPAFPNPAATRLLGVPATSQYLVTIFSRLGERPYVFTHAVVTDASSKPIFAYGFAVPAEYPVGRAVRAVLATQPVLPSTLTRGVKVDSILAVTVSSLSRAIIYQSNASVSTLFAATDSLEAKVGGLHFEVAINPDAADRLIIGGLPRSRLPETLATTFVSVCLLGLLLFQFRKQEELGRLRDEFVSGVSHELRTPLAQIRLLAELLRMGKVPSDEQKERSLRIIDKEARRLSFLVDSILNFTHSERNKMSPVRTDVATEIEEIIAGFEPLAEAQNIRLIARLERGIFADVDRGAMRQVLLNLLDNAVRYGPQGQSVIISTTSAKDNWMLEVVDEGPGIPVDERERIFAPYYRMKRDAGGAVGGTGIGLAVVRRLVTQLDGQVRVVTANRDDSNGTQLMGARFIVELPITHNDVKQS